MRRAIASRVAFIIDRWIAALIAGGLSEQERDVTVRALEDKYPEAVEVWRRMLCLTGLERPAGRTGAVSVLWQADGAQRIVIID